MHAQLHMCACPNRPSCNLSSASRLSSTDSRPAPGRSSTAGGHSQAQAREAARAPPRPWGPPNLTCLGGSPGMSRPAPPPPLTSQCCVFFPPDKITLWIAVACYLFMVDLRQYRPHSSQDRSFKADGLCRLHSFRTWFLAPGTGPGRDRVLRNRPWLAEY